MSYYAVGTVVVDPWPTGTKIAENDPRMEVSVEYDRWQTPPIWNRPTDQVLVEVPRTGGVVATTIDITGNVNTATRKPPGVGIPWGTLAIVGGVAAGIMLLLKK